MSGCQGHQLQTNDDACVTVSVSAWTRDEDTVQQSVVAADVHAVCLFPSPYSWLGSCTSPVPTGSTSCCKRDSLGKGIKERETSHRLDSRTNRHSQIRQQEVRRPDHRLMHV